MLSFLDIQFDFIFLYVKTQNNKQLEVKFKKIISHSKGPMASECLKKPLGRVASQASATRFQTWCLAAKNLVS